MTSTALTPATAPQTFTFATQTLRVVLRDGEPWFVAVDVCAALELGNVTKALLRLDDDEQALISIQGISRGNDQANIVNESGLYSLILGSRKPEAKRFKKWVTSEVLPSIRKTGSYAAQADPEAYRRISPEQHAQLTQAIAQVTGGWLFQGQGAGMHIHNHLRHAFNVRGIEDLPAASFDAALALVKSKEEACQQALIFVRDFRNWFAAECLSGGTPWTPAIQARLTKERGERIRLPARVDWLALANPKKEGK